MKLYEVQTRSPLLIQNLLTLWEESVRATHLFLSDAEIMQIKDYVPQALNSVAHLIIAERRRDVPAAFMGIEQGLGRQLLQFGIQEYGVRELTVNEQNPQAVGFYEHLGFEICKRTDCDEEGRPYPLLYMRLKG